MGNEQWAMSNGQWAMGNGQPASQEQGMSLLFYKPLKQVKQMAAGLRFFTYKGLRP